MTRIMPSMKGDDTNFEFEVGRERLKLSNGQDTGFDALYRKDSGIALSVVSPRYKITPHTEANGFVEQLLGKQNINYEIGKTAVAAKGNRFFREFRFPDLKFVPQGATSTALDGGGDNDEYMPTIIVRNSYDRSSSLDFMYGGFRMVCSNGLVVGNILDRFTVNHVNRPDYDSIGDRLVDNLESTIENFKRTYDRLNNQEANPYVQLLLMETFSKKMAEAAALMSKGMIHIDYDADGEILEVTAGANLSAYALMNIATEIATHHVRKFHRSIELQKKISKVFDM